MVVGVLKLQATVLEVIEYFEILGIRCTRGKIEYFEILGIGYSLVLEDFEFLGIEYSLALEYFENLGIKYHPKSTFTRVPRRQYSPFVTCGEYR